MAKSIKDIKVVLVSPPQNFLANPLMAEPLGLMYLEGVLQEMGVETEMIDMSFDKEMPEADIYCFSASTIHFPQVVEYAKKVSPAFTVIGGPHASALPEEAKQFFDAVVIGPGEKAIVKIISDFLDGKKGGIYRQPVDNIDSIPIPPRTILNRIKYNPFYGTPSDRSASIISSRGCPYQCAFCASNVIWGRNVQFHSVKRVVKEIAYLKEKFGIKYFKFIDDIFTLNKERFREFSKALHELDIKWACEARINTVDDEILDEMIKNGCEAVDLGIESVNDLVLKKINKMQTSSMAKEAIARIKAKGLKVKIYLIYGLPFEPKDIVQQTIDFVRETDPDYVSLFTLVPYPGTDIWNNPKKYNIKNIITDFGKYQHSVGGVEEELKWLSNVEYFDRSREQMRDERNILKKFAMEWNKVKTKQKI